MFHVPALELGIDNAIALAIVHYRYTLWLGNILIAFPNLLKILATCHNVNFWFATAKLLNIYNVT